MSEFKVTYYVGVMLAQGGSLIIREDQLLFAPRPIERAMGATDTAIPFKEINMVDITGTITESLIVRTPKKPHRFVGGDLYKIRDLIHSALQEYQQKSSSLSSVKTAEKTADLVSVKSKIKAQCSSCGEPVQNEFHFCPHCKAVLKAACSKCYRTIGEEWKFCAFCGNAI